MGFRQYQDFSLEIFVSDWKKGDFQIAGKISGDADLVPRAPSVTPVRNNLIWVLYPPFSQLIKWNSQRMRGKTISTVSSLEWKLLTRPDANTKGSSDTQLQKFHSSSNMVIPEHRVAQPFLPTSILEILPEFCLSTVIQPSSMLLKFIW